MGLFGLLKPTSVKPAPADDSHDTDQQQSDVHEDQPTSRRIMPVLTPPMQLGQSSSDLDDDDVGMKSGNIISRIVELFKGVGSDLTRFQVPVQFNLPKSQLQLYGELVYSFNVDLLSACADCETPLDRFLAAVRWHISSTRPPHFGKAPFNPILGETHHVSVGDLNVLLEQVSHHPPVSALHATNEQKGIQLHFWHQASPRFYGSGVDVTIHGRRFLKLQRFGESYEMTSPKLGFRFLPVPGTDWNGGTTVYCPQTGLKAAVTYRGKALFGLHGPSRRVSGKVWDTKSGQTLFDIHGYWDQVVYVKDKSGGNTTTLYDAKAMLCGLKTPQVKNVNAISQMESSLVWGNVSESLIVKDMDKARGAKTRIEEEQRAVRKERQCAGLNWSPKFFTLSPAGDWEWQHADQPVPPAPIVVPC